MADDLIVWTGLAEFQRDLKKLDTGLDKQLQKQMKDAAKGTAAQAKEEALSRGLWSTRDRVHLANKNQPVATQKMVAIRNQAKNADGFRYGAIYEYGGADVRITLGRDNAIRNRSEQGARLKAMGTSLLPGYGPRAFIAPAIVKSLPDFQEKLIEAIDDTARRAGFK